MPRQYFWFKVVCVLLAVVGGIVGGIAGYGFIWLLTKI